MCLLCLLLRLCVLVVVSFPIVGAAIVMHWLVIVLVLVVVIVMVVVVVVVMGVVHNTLPPISNIVVPRCVISCCRSFVLEFAHDIVTIACIAFCATLFRLPKMFTFLTEQLLTKDGVFGCNQSAAPTKPNNNHYHTMSPVDFPVVIALT